jgi:excisionase family DNA binding protein
MPTMSAKRPPLDAEWMTVQEAADVLGVSRPTVMSWALAGQLVTTMIGRRHFVSRASVDAALRAQEK